MEVYLILTGCAGKSGWRIAQVDDGSGDIVHQHIDEFDRMLAAIFDLCPEGVGDATGGSSSNGAGRSKDSRPLLLSDVGVVAETRG